MIDLSIFFSYFFKNPFTIAGISVLIFSICVGIIKCLTSHSCQDLGRFLTIPVLTLILLLILSFFTTMIKAGNEAKQNVETTEQTTEQTADEKIISEETNVIMAGKKGEKNENKRIYYYFF